MFCLIDTVGGHPVEQQGASGAAEMDTPATDEVDALG